MTLSDRDLRILGVATDDPETATMIFRRFLGFPMGSSLSTRRRKERRYLATDLEDLARRGYLVRSRGDSEGHDVPVYALSQLGRDTLGRAA